MPQGSARRADKKISKIFKIAFDKSEIDDILSNVSSPVRSREPPGGKETLIKKISKIFKTSLDKRKNE